MFHYVSAVHINGNRAGRGALPSIAYDTYSTWRMAIHFHSFA